MIPEEKSSSSTWFIWSLDEVLGSEGFAIGIFGVRREPGVQVSAENVHQDLGKHNQTSLKQPQNQQIPPPGVNPNLWFQFWFNPRFRSRFVLKSPISDLAENSRRSKPTPNPARKLLLFPS